MKAVSKDYFLILVFINVMKTFFTDFKLGFGLHPLDKDLFYGSQAKFWSSSA
jgi:hypothetical protein